VGAIVGSLGRWAASNKEEEEERTQKAWKHPKNKTPLGE
jgi:hypothetical protein